MALRDTNLRKLSQRSFDVLVVGGGINGAVSAAALANRGLRVALIDKGDFAGATSQSSSNLAWGGIKYMESYEFSLVRKLSMSRNELMRAYPSTVKEIRFFTTIAQGFRKNRVLVFLGALLYWLIGNFFTARPRLLSVRDIEREEPRIDVKNAAGGVEYSDAYLHDNDARFVFGFVRSAINYGCIAANYVSAGQATRDGDGWRVEAKNERTGDRFAIQTKVVVNAAGPFADAYNEVNEMKTRHRHVFSKGIHLIVNRITPSRRVLTFFASDGRLFFAIPMGPKTCIGTTDTRVLDPETGVTPDDRAFVLHNINALLRFDPLLEERDIIAERCGVRPLVVEGKVAEDTEWVQLSRKHVIEVDGERKWLSIFGGKLTDCLNVGEEVCSLVEGLGISIPHRNRVWYGEPGAAVREEFYQQAEQMGLDEMTDESATEPLSQRLWRRYGARAFAILEDIRQDASKAKLLIKRAEYIRGEIEHAAKTEMITKLEDFLRRRSKIAQVVPQRVLEESEGLKEACDIFFGNAADERWIEYFGRSPSERRRGKEV